MNRVYVSMMREHEAVEGDTRARRKRAIRGEALNMFCHDADNVVVHTMEIRQKNDPRSTEGLRVLCLCLNCAKRSIAATAAGASPNANEGRHVPHVLL